MVVVSPNFSAPEEGVLFQAPCTKLLINGQEIGTGSLYITENNVLWGGGVTASGASVCTISMMYPTISMHAIQREPTVALMVVVNYDLRIPELSPSQSSGAGDANNADAGEAIDEDEDDDFDPDFTPTTELKFLPQNEADLLPMYAAMCQGQELHPDPTDEDDEDHYMDGEEFEANEGGDEGEGDEEEFEDAEESNAAPEDAAARLRQMRLENGNKHDDEDD